MAHVVAFAAIRTTKTREHFAVSSYTTQLLVQTIASADNAQHKNCPSSGIDDRPGRDLFKALKRSPISQAHTHGLRRGYSDGNGLRRGYSDGLRRGYSDGRLFRFPMGKSYSDGKAVGNTTGLTQRSHPHWRISLLQSLCWALGQTEESSNF